MEKMKFEFSAKAYQYSSAEDMCGWTFVSLPKDLSAEIRANFKWQEEGWGRMKITAKLGGSEWQTSIWFDTKHGAYLLPLKAQIRKREKVASGDEVKITILV